jgi:hypothetical protein
VLFVDVVVSVDGDEVNDHVKVNDLAAAEIAVGYRSSIGALPSATRTSVMDRKRRLR